MSDLFPQDLSEMGWKKFKIVSDGTPTGTLIYDAKTGEKISNVAAIEFKLSVDDLVPQLVLTFNEGIADFRLESEVELPFYTSEDLSEFKVGGTDPE